MQPYNACAITIKALPKHLLFCTLYVFYKMNIPLSENTRRVLRRRIHKARFIASYPVFRAFTHDHTLDHLFIAGMQKTGSQWLSQFFDDARIRKYTKLLKYPQHNYDAHEFHTKFPRYTFVPGLYIVYHEYWLLVKKHSNSKTIYIKRDPRDIVVSWYHSMLKTHEISPPIKIIRDDLSRLSLEEGISYCIQFLSYKLNGMRSWTELSGNDKNIHIVKFEDLTTRPNEEFKSIFMFLNIGIPDYLIEEMTTDYSKDRMRQKDLHKRKDTSESHYRTKGSHHSDVFTDEHYAMFYESTGNLVEALGYSK